MAETITPWEFLAADGVEDWRVVSDGVCAFFRTNAFADAARFVQAIGAQPGIEEHPPDIDIRPDGVTVRLITITAENYGTSRHHIDVARQVSAVAREQGLATDPSAIQSVLIIPGGASTSAIMPFWEAALGYMRRPDSPEEDMVDPHNRGPAFWFEQMQEPRADRGGGDIHLAVWVPFEVAQARIDAALAAGGHMVRDTFAPSWWTIADAANNEVDIATISGRDRQVPEDA